MLAQGISSAFQPQTGFSSSIFASGLWGHKSGWRSKKQGPQTHGYMKGFVFFPPSMTTTWARALRPCASCALMKEFVWGKSDFHSGNGRICPDVSRVGSLRPPSSALSPLRPTEGRGLGLMVVLERSEPHDFYLYIYIYIYLGGGNNPIFFSWHFGGVQVPF